MLKIFKSQSGLILILSTELKIMEVTDALLQELQFSREELRGKHICDVFSPGSATLKENSVDILQHSLDKVLESRQQDKIEVIQYDIPNPEEQGKYLERYWQTISTPVPDQQGEVLCIILEIKNITEKIKAERQLQESLRREKAALARAEHQRIRLERYFMQVPAQICIFSGSDFVFEFVNPAYQETLFPGRKILGKPLAEAVPEVMGQPIAEVLRKVYETGETIEGKEVYIPLKPYDGAPLKDYYFNYIHQARFDENGKVDGIMTFAYDVTELVEARKKVQALNKDLEERIFARTKELQLARADAERQQERLQNLFMQAPVAICIFKGPSMVYDLVNPAYQAMFPGRTIKGRSLIDAIPELFDSPVWGHLQYVYQTGNIYKAKEALIPVARIEEGPVESLYFDYVLQPHYNREREIDGVLTFAYDVTEQVMARRNVEQKEEILQFALQAGKMATFDLDLKTNQTVRSANHDRLFGYSFNIPEWNMEALMKHMLPEDHAPLLQQFEKSLQTGELWLTPRIQQKDGNLRYIEGYGRVFYEKGLDGEGMRKPVRIAGVVTDVTERKHNQQQKERLAAIVENSYDLISLCTPEGICIYLNQAGKKMVGIKDLQDTGDYKLTDFVAERHQKFHQMEIMPAIIEQGSWQGELLFRHQATGNLIPVYYTAFSIKDPSTEELLGIATITSDITDLKKKEEQLHILSRELAEANREMLGANKAIQASNKELEEANQQLRLINADLDNFIYAASHDLKAPITNIEGLVQLLNRKLPEEVLGEEKIRQIIRMIQESIGRFQKTITNLTDITRLQKDNNKEETWVELLEVLDEVVLDLKPMIQKAGVEIDVEVEGCPAVSFAEKNMRSIMYNLISNAIKYRSPERKPEVKIKCKEEPGFLVLEVIDNGLGLNPANEKKLFSMFKRFHSHVEGSGIGLYMVKKIIENAGGKIEVASQLDKGSTFSVYFRR